MNELPYWWWWAPALSAVLTTVIAAFLLPIAISIYRIENWILTWPLDRLERYERRDAFESQLAAFLEREQRLGYRPVESGIRLFGRMLGTLPIDAWDTTRAITDNVALAIDRIAVRTGFSICWPVVSFAAVRYRLGQESVMGTTAAMSMMLLLGGALVVYTIANSGSLIAPAGYMGDIDRISVDTFYASELHMPTDNSLRVSYQPGSMNWAGVYFLQTSVRLPQGNWGDEPGLNLCGVQRLTFWARGERGGERVEFKAGGVGVQNSAKPYHDSFDVTLGTITLTRDWRAYTIDLTGRNLSSVLGVFAFIASGENNPDGLTFYLSEPTYQFQPSMRRPSSFGRADPRSFTGPFVGTSVSLTSLELSSGARPGCLSAWAA